MHNDILFKVDYVYRYYRCQDCNKVRKEMKLRSKLGSYLFKLAAWVSPDGKTTIVPGKHTLFTNAGGVFTSSSKPAVKPRKKKSGNK